MYPYAPSGRWDHVAKWWRTTAAAALTLREAVAAECWGMYLRRRAMEGSWKVRGRFAEGSWKVRVHIYNVHAVVDGGQLRGGEPLPYIYINNM